MKIKSYEEYKSAIRAKKVADLNAKVAEVEKAIDCAYALKGELATLISVLGYTMVNYFPLDNNYLNLELLNTGVYKDGEGVLGAYGDKISDKLFFSFNPNGGISVAYNDIITQEHGSVVINAIESIGTIAPMSGEAIKWIHDLTEDEYRHLTICIAQFTNRLKEFIYDFFREIHTKTNLPIEEE